jgi:hypothetical protein
MKISLNIQDSKAVAFINFIKTLDYVKLESSGESEIELTDELKTALDDAIRSLKDEGGISNSQMTSDTKKKFPSLFK